jgi:putative protein-disulfide isomerase
MRPWSRAKMPATLEMVYFADPMCSWCYGFAPVISALAERFEARLPLRLVMGGLFAGNQKAMRGVDKDYIRQAWTQVGAATGQPFDMDFFARANFSYDTEPACRAVVTVRRMLPPLALPFMGRLQQAFYAENRDVTSATEISDVAEEAGLERTAFGAMFGAAQTRNETFRDFLSAQELGIRGFPTLIAGSQKKGYALVSNGYRPLEDLLQPLERWLAAGAPVSTST